METRVSLAALVGRGYKEFWQSRCTYVVCKGSRGSKKSKTAALWHIYHMMRYPQSNTLVVRKVERTLRDSAYSDLRWAIHRLGVDAYWKCTTSPMELEYVPTGQKILFRGLDSPLKLTSISVPTGVLNFLWLEEAYEIMSETDFDTLDESIRGEMPDGLWKRITITFNPWSEKHWLKRRFFDRPADNVLAMTTTYLCNEWLSDTDRQLFEDMRLRNARRYQVAALGNWGISDGLVYDNWKEKAFELSDLPRDARSAFGLDFGYTNDPSALFCGFHSASERRIYVWDEMYKKGLSNRAIFDEVKSMGYLKERITGDSAEPKSIDELRMMGMRIKGATKGRDSVQNGVQWVQDQEIIVHPRCVNFLTEISNYTWDADKFGNKLNVPVDDFNHLMDAMRYGMEDCMGRTRAGAARRL